MVERPKIPAFKFGSGSRVRFKVMEPSLEDPNQIRMFEGVFAGIMVDPKFAPIPMYTFLMNVGTEDKFIKLVPVHAIMYIDILDFEEVSDDDLKRFDAKIEGDESIYV